MRNIILTFLVLAGSGFSGLAEETVWQGFVGETCLDCHDTEARKGGLDLSGLSGDLSDRTVFAQWVRMFDRVEAGEMPPKDKGQPAPEERERFLDGMRSALTKAEEEATARNGRSVRRRLNRYEYENALRDLLAAPWLQVKDRLPEDGEAYRFNRSGEALDVSHVQMARYLQTADEVLREVMATDPERPPTETGRYYTRDDRNWTRRMQFNEFNRSPERATFPVLGFAPQPEVRAGKAPVTAGEGSPELREQEGMGVVASSYEPMQPQWSRFKAPVSGRYRLRVMAHSVWVGAGKEKRWWTPDLDQVTRGRRSEPVTLYGVMPPQMLRRLADFDAEVEPVPFETEVWLQAGEMIRPDAVRLFRSRPPAWHNPLATREGQPGVSFRWLEVEGPLFDQWPAAGQDLLFGGLALKDSTVAGLPVEAVPENPDADARRLMERFVERACRQPAGPEAVDRFLGVVRQAGATGSGFTEAMLAGYTAVLCSPEFLYDQENPGALTDAGLASRLASFLTNSVPDAALRQAANEGRLHHPEGLRAETDRLLDSPEAARFVEAFLDYWLDLRRDSETSPDSALYADYYLDDFVVQSARQEARSFFQQLVREDLPAVNLVDSDFVMINGRLAELYGIPEVTGAVFRKVSVPQGNPRGGLMTQAIVLKVTANGTTTSPVLRGAWIMERLLGRKVPPPPPGVGAVEPDIRGAATIRQQLEKHRSQASCASCHNLIDPAGFALESFDVMGGWRDRYRALGEKDRVPGFGKNGQPFEFREGLPVDSSGLLPDGRAFSGIRELKQLLREDERRIARNLAGQLTVFATGTPVRFSDRPAVEKILEETRRNGYGVRALIHALIQSPLFLNK